MKLYIYILVLTLMPMIAKAQNNLLGLSWNIILPSGSSADFVDETSIRSGQFESRNFFRSNISTGLSVGWNAYQEYQPRRTYPIENGAITTDLTKYVYTLPILFNAHYYYQVNKAIRPYAGLGISTMYSEREVFFNLCSLVDKAWGFAFRPEVGVLFPFGSGFGAMIAADYLMTTNDSGDLDINSTNSFNFRVGFLLVR